MKDEMIFSGDSTERGQAQAHTVPEVPAQGVSVSVRAFAAMQGTCEEEVQRIEAFLDTVMRRTQGLAQRAAANEALWKGQGIPWDAAIFASVRANSLHLATLYMSR